MAAEVEAQRDAELGGKVDQLVNEEFDGPKLGGLVPEMGRAPISELVVEDDGAVASFREVTDGEDVVVNEA
jgi:hypothetical protein